MQVTRKQVEGVFLKRGKLQGVKTNMKESVGLNITEFFQRVSRSATITEELSVSVAGYINAELPHTYAWLRERFINAAVGGSFKAHGGAEWHHMCYERRRVLTMISYMLMSELNLSLVEVVKKKGLSDVHWLEDDLAEIGHFQYLWAAPPCGGQATMRGVSSLSGSSCSMVILDEIHSNLNMENKMSNTNTSKPIVQQTLVFGVPFESLSEDEMFTVINEHKKKVDELRARKVQPKALRAKIKAMDEEVDALVELVDSRYKAE